MLATEHAWICTELFIIPTYMNTQIRLIVVSEECIIRQFEPILFSGITIVCAKLIFTGRYQSAL